MATRRTFLAGAAAVAVPTVALAGAPVASEAELVTIGQEATRLRKQYGHLALQWWRMSAEDPGLRALADEMDGPHDRLCELAARAVLLPATTLEGVRAKAELARHTMAIECETEGQMEFDCRDQELVWSLLCDITGRA